jgi:pyridoxal phosphate enzyme (YggS family)
LSLDRRDRREDVAAGLAATRARIEAACTDAGRHPDEVTLVVVTKTFPASDVRHLYALGVRDVGENRHPEAGRKAAETADLQLRWHFIGQLQTNKAKAVAGYAAAVHSVDRLKLVHALAAGAEAAERDLDVLVQVSLDPEETAAGRGGVDPHEVAPLAAAVAASRRLVLRGVMAVAPLGADPDVAFARLAETSAAVRAVHPAATWVSAGMSADLEAAVRHGATHVRVGSAILGTRPTPR